MADGTTPFLSLVLPEIDGSADTWGQKLNGNFGSLDTYASGLQALIDAAVSAAFPSGTIMAFHGPAIPIGWLLCDGTNGTPDLRGRFLVGAGTGDYALGGTGGYAMQSLTVAQLPVHTHGVNDPSHGHGVGDFGHSHTVADYGHTHGVNDPSHSHTFPVIGVGSSAPAGVSGSPAASGPFATDAAVTSISIASASTGVVINAGTTGIGIYADTTGISIATTGGGQAFDNRPPYMAVFYIMKA